MAEPLTTQSVEDVETKLNEAVNNIKNPNSKQAMQNIKDLIWSQKNVIKDMDEISQNDFGNFAQGMKVIESDEIGISLIVSLLNANFTNASKLQKYQEENSEEFSDLADFNLCFLRFYGKYIESENFSKDFFNNFFVNIAKKNLTFIAYPMIRESVSVGIPVKTSEMLKEKQNALFWIYSTLCELFDADNKYEKELIVGKIKTLFSTLEARVRNLEKERFNNFLYQKMLEDNKNFDDFMNIWFKVKDDSDFFMNNWGSVCELMQDWERFYQNMKLIRFMKLFVNNIESTEEIEKFFLNSFDELLKIMSFNDLSFTNMEGCRNSLNKKIDDGSFENGKTIKELLDRYIFRSRFSRFFKKAIEDEEFLNFVSKDDENFQALKKCYDENSRLFYNRDVTWETKVKVTLIKEGKVFSDDTVLVMGEVNRTSVIERMDKRPELEGGEIVILFELSSRSWWWNRSLCLNLNKGSFTKLAKITEKVSNQKEFLDWIYSNRKKLIVKNRGENSNTLVTNFEELAQDAGFFILSDNQKKVFDRIPEENREEFKNNFVQHPEFRAIVELLGQTITDTENFVKLYGGFIWTLNLVAVQLSFAMQLTFLNAMKGFVEELERNQSENLQEIKDTIKNESFRIPQIESQPEVVQI